MSQIRKAFNKAANEYDDCAFLQQEIATRLERKLDVVASNAEVIIDLGAGTGLLTQQLSKRFAESQIICIDFAQKMLKHNLAMDKICANAYHLPIADNSVDIVISNLMLQWCGDLNKVFSECHRVLKDDSLLLFSTFGIDTLRELKKSWSVVDDDNHVNTFVDMHDIGDQLLQNGFQSPVMEMETLTLTYQTVVDLLKDLKAIGAQTVENRPKSLTGKKKFQLMTEMYESYRKGGKLPATYEIIYGHAWTLSKKTHRLGTLPLENAIL